MNWIKTSERLPEIEVEVIIVVDEIKDFATLEDDNSWRDKFGDLLYATIESVEYWMPLPPLPEEQG